ncbi:hypothetical protein AAA214_03635 [Parabacteroides goldsteinii]|uniref:hypothetical protein n=1 Tax=Parabacteroides goldsteinii TaxID=328812 RepID=UPI0032BFC8DF
MDTYADRIQRNHNRPVVDRRALNGDGSGSASRFVDNRPEAAIQAEWQGIADRSSRAGQFSGIQAMANATPIQRTVYKASREEGTSRIKGIERYANRISDRNEPESLFHLPPGSKLMELATSPITIFMHGTELRAMTASAFADFLRERGFVPSPGTEIVFIACEGATLMDEFLVSKGQALADILDATVYLAKGTVSINSEGVPVVKKKDGSGEYRHITSQDEMSRIIPEEAEGWVTYRPQGVTFEMVRDEIRRVNSMYSNLWNLEFCRDSLAPRMNSVREIEQELRVDRTKIATRYVEVKAIAGEMEKYLPYRDFNWELRSTIYSLKSMRGRTIKYKDQVEAWILKYKGWRGRILKGSGEIEELHRLYLDEQKRWIEPLKAEIAKEERERIRAEQEAKAMEEENGWDFDLSDESEDDTSGGGSGDAAHVQQASVGGGIAQRKVDDRNPPTANGKKLSEILARMPHMDLVEGENDPHLSLCYESMRPYGYTLLKANGEQCAFEHISDATANDKYVIVIALNKEVYHGGKNAEAMGSLIETLVHEWALHGAECAVNIDAARQGKPTGLKIGHDAFFSEEQTDMDVGIASQISREKDSSYVGAIYESYIRDTDTHRDMLLDGWAGRGQKGRYLYSKLGMLQIIGKSDKFMEALKATGLEAAYQNLAAVTSGHTGNYRGFNNLSDIDIPTTIGYLRAMLPLAVPDEYPAIKEFRDGVLNELIVLLEELGKIRLSDHSMDSRKAVLARLGVDTVTFDSQVDLTSEADRGADFKLSSKKLD